MDLDQSDQFAQTPSPGVRRRGVLAGFAGVFAPLLLPAAAGAGKRKPKIQLNEFGCVNVGNACRHFDDCCSGICKGKKGRKRCRAHDTGGCRVEQKGLPCTSSAGQDGLCDVTTGNASYCESGSFGDVQQPFCARDADCQAKSGNPRAACLSDGHICAVP